MLSDWAELKKSFIIMKTIYSKISWLSMTVLFSIIMIMLSACSGESIRYLTVNVDNVLYSLSDDGDYAIASGYNYKDVDSQSSLLIQDFVSANGKEYKVTGICERAFINSKFSTVDLGSSIDVIEREAFKYSTTIEEISFSGNTLPVLYENAFEESVYDSAVLIIPENTPVSAPWDKFKNVKRSFVLDIE